MNEVSVTYKVGSVEEQIATHQSKIDKKYELVKNALPRMNKWSIGYEHELFGLIQESAYEDSRKADPYPPYNIYKWDTAETVNDLGFIRRFYSIQIAVAGFSIDQLSISNPDGYLVVRGDGSAEHEAAVDSRTKTGIDDFSNRSILHSGLAKRRFHLQFRLNSSVKVLSAVLENDGTLVVQLENIMPRHGFNNQIAIEQNPPLSDYQTFKAANLPEPGAEFLILDRTVEPATKKSKK